MRRADSFQQRLLDLGLHTDDFGPRRQFIERLGVQAQPDRNIARQSAVGEAEIVIGLFCDSSLPPRIDQHIPHRQDGQNHQ